MARFLKTLATLGLVELDESEKAALDAERGPESADDIERLLAETRAMTAGLEGAEAEAAPPAAEPAAGSTAEQAVVQAPPAPVEGLPEGRSFEDLYVEAGVANSPYPAEQLLRLLDGLAAMEPAVRKAAVVAMDQADPSWTIGDSLLDAERKVAVLQGVATQLDATVKATEQQASERLAAQEARGAEAQEKIKAQIAELEDLLAEEMAAVATEKAAIESHLEATRSARDREHQRLQREMERLGALYTMFETPDEEP